MAFLAGHAHAQDIAGPDGSDAPRKWQPVTITFSGGPERAENEATFRDFRFDLLVTTPSGEELRVPGFFAADGNAANSSATRGDQWRARFLPREEGTYRYEASFRTGPGVATRLGPSAGRSAGSFDGASGSFTVRAAEGGAPGFYSKGLLAQVEGERFLRFDNGELFFKGGPDSPENLLAYSDFDGTYNAGGKNYVRSYDPHARDWRSGDPDWAGESGRELIGAINYLAGEGLNSISFLPMNVRGDGNDVWPWTAPDERFVYDVSKLAQWDVVFSHATRQGFFLHFKTQETENDQLLNGGGLGDERKVYYRELVARFGYHPALNWNLGEENTNSDSEREAFAAYFKDLDPYDHPVVVHTYPGQKDNVYEPLLGFEPFDGPSLQLGQMSDSQAWNAGREWLTKSDAAGDQWVCSVDEPGNAGNGVYQGGGGPNGGNLPEAREVMYASYLAGCYGTEWYFGYNHPDGDLDLDDFRSRSTWWDQVDVALGAVRDFYDGAAALQAGTSHREIERGYAMEGQDRGGTAQAIAYLKEGRSSFGTSYKSAVYVNPRTGERSGEEPVGSGGLEAPFSGDAVALLSGNSSGGGGDDGGGGSDDGSDGGGNAPEVAGFTLINADTDEAIGSLEDGDTVDLSTLGTGNLSVRANANGRTESVVFDFDGNRSVQTESQLPYALFGDSNGDYKGRAFGEGRYTIAATPYDRNSGNGKAGATVSVRFSVTKDGGGNGGDGGDGGGNAPAPAVTSLTLINADTGEDLRALKDGDTIDPGATGTDRFNVRASVNGETESVVFGFDGDDRFRTESRDPYALFGDTGGRTFAEGDYTLTATPYSQDGGGGSEGPVQAVNFTVASGDDGGGGDGGNAGPEVTSLTLVNADTDEDIGPLEDGDTIDLKAIGTDKLSVRANVDGGTESVVFAFDGEDPYQVESIAAYALAGNSGSDYAPVDFSEGRYTLAATPYAKRGGGGKAGATRTVRFEVVRGGSGDDSDGGGEGSNGEGEVVFAVNAGGPAYTSPDGVTYQADDAFDGGRAYSNDNAISGTGADVLYQSERVVNFSYAVPLEDGTYEVTLLLAEIYWSEAGERVFDVEAEGQEIVSDLDIYAEVGANAAYTVTRTVAVSDGELTLTFDGDVDNAKLSALRVRSSSGNGGSEPGRCSATEDVVAKADGLPLSFFGTNVGTQKTATVNLPSLARGVERATLTLTAEDVDQRDEATLLVNGTEVALPRGLAEPQGESRDALTGRVALDPELLEGGTNRITLAFASDLGGTTSGYRVTGAQVELARCTAGARAAASGAEGAFQSGGGAPVEEFALEANYPNPFAEGTTIRFALPEPARVRLAVYDMLGREVAVLVDGRHAAGRHAVRWEPAGGAASGVYLYRMTAGGFTASGQMVLVK